MKLGLAIPGLFALCCLITLPCDCYADGTVVRLQEDKGPFVVTILTPAELAQDRPAEVGVLVQGRDSNDVLLDADVDLMFKPPVASGPGMSDEICGFEQGASFDRLPSQTEAFAVSASRGRVANKLLSTVRIRLGLSGDWQLEAVVKCEGKVATFVCLLPVGTPSGGLTHLVAYLLFPPCVVSLFLANKILTQRS